MAVLAYAGQKLRASFLQDMIDDHLRVAKVGDTIRNNTATISDDPELTLQVKAGYTYIVRIVAYYTSGATPDIQFALRFPSGSTPFGGLRMVNTSAALVGDVDPGAYSSGISATSVIIAGGTGAPATTLLEATIAVGSTAGALTVVWAQATANASNTTLHTGSCLTAERIR